MRAALPLSFGKAVHGKTSAIGSRSDSCCTPVRSDATKGEKRIDDILKKAKSDSRFVEICDKLAEKYGESPHAMLHSLGSDGKAAGGSKSEL